MSAKRLYLGFTLIAMIGIPASVQAEDDYERSGYYLGAGLGLGFDFPDFHSAWTALAGATTAHLPPDQQQAAQRAVQQEMYPHGDGPRHFDNLTQFIIGDRHGP